MIKYKGVSTLEVLEGANNYNKWIAETFLPYITTPALEIGSGIGNITKHLIKDNCLYISDKDLDLVKHLKKRFSTYNNLNFFQFDISKKAPSKFINYFSVVLGINVLEHIEDDVETLKNLRSILKKDGKLLLFVPFGKFAFSRLDKELGHYRRYEKEEIIKKLNEAGFKVEKIYNFNIVGLLSWYIRDRISKSYNLKAYQVAVFDSIVPILKKIESMWHPPVGISLVVYAQKI